jgi:RHS repeat-associated protein
MLTDGLGSVRGVVDTNANVLWSVNLDGYGNPFSTVGTAQTNYGFTGEYGLPGGLLHLRARNYHPALGVFTALDPFEGMMGRAMSLNGYGWVEGNVVNAIDPSGMIFESPNNWYSCSSSNGGGVSVSPDCNSLIQTLASGDFPRFMAQNSGLDEYSAVNALIAAWRKCPCTFFRSRGVSSTSNPLYNYLTLRLNEIRNGLQNLIYDVLDDKGAARILIQQLYSMDYMNPVQCSYYEVTPPSPYPPLPAPCTDLFDPAAVPNQAALLPPFNDKDRIRSVGVLLNASAMLPKHISIGGGVVLMFNGNNFDNLDMMNCTGFGNLQIGPNIGADGHGEFSGIVLSNSTAETSFTGISAGISVDFEASRLGINLPVNVNMGMSRTIGSCDFSVYYGLGTPGKASITFAFGTGIPMSCQDIGISPRQVKAYADQILPLLQ